MKSKIFISIAIVAIAFSIFSCKSTGTKDEKIDIIDSGKLDTENLKEEIVDIIMSLPDNQETVNLINETGAAYIAGLTLENLKAESLLTRAENAKAYGGVLFDMAYASTYNQTNTFSKLLDLNENLVRKLGFTDFLKQQQDYKKRYIDAKDDEDAVDKIVSELLNSTNTYIQENGNASDISLIFAGATTKSLNVISNITIYAMNNEKLVDLIKNQKSKLESAYKILQMAGQDEEVKEMATAIKPVLEVYSSSEEFNLEDVEKIRDLTSFVME